MATIQVKQEPGCPPVRIKQEPRQPPITVKSEPGNSSSTRNTRPNSTRVNDGASTSAAASSTTPKSSSSGTNKPNLPRVNDGASTSTGPRSTPLSSSSRNHRTSSGRVNDGASGSAGASSAPDFIPLRKHCSRGKKKQWGSKRKQQEMNKSKESKVKGENVPKNKRRPRSPRIRRACRVPQSNISMSFSAQAPPRASPAPVTDPKPEPIARAEQNDEVQVLSDSEVEIIGEVFHTEPKPMSEDEIIVIDDIENTSNKENIQQGGSSAGQRLRPIIVDGSNVAMAHGLHEKFSWRGIQICIDYFLANGHEDIKVFVPNHRKCGASRDARQLIDDLQRRGLLIFTPSRYVKRRLITSEDDRFIIEYATKSQGVIVSRDQYRDMMQENKDWRETVEKRLLQYTFVGDTIMFPLDPMGRNGPHLSQFLRFPDAQL